MNHIQRPEPNEYKPSFQKYMDLVPDGDFLNVMAANTTDVIAFFESLPPERHSYRYAEDKWSIKQVLLHLTDVERMMGYRALVAARSDDKTPLHSFDDNHYAAHANADSRTMQDLLEEFKAVRAATTKFFETVTDAQSVFPANAVTYTTTARALGYMILGHTWHHINIINERYIS